MARISTVEQLRQVLPEPRATTKLKILPELDEQAREFIETSPVPVSGDGRQERHGRGFAEGR